MRWGRFEADGQVRYGIVHGDEVELVIGSPFAGYEPAADRRPLDSLRLLTPVEPRTFYAAGLNYLEHIREQAASRGVEPDVPPQAPISDTGPTTRSSRTARPSSSRATRRDRWSTRRSWSRSSDGGRRT